MEQLKAAEFRARTAAQQQLNKEAGVAAPQQAPPAGQAPPAPAAAPAAQ